ncbi:uncharacterized protein SOCEGT47_014480 [Sorangium cellulosum]|uniref:Uncharacterized protein n=1 Tax=Sorangium cellulosum TaxID=56 RepID=A0A4P2PWL2_SORCE|nr:uncharacterized protein SOCEGT47_014480 [Sorangium cellulosum]
MPKPGAWPLGPGWAHASRGGAIRRHALAKSPGMRQIATVCPRGRVPREKTDPGWEPRWSEVT